jgi:predicted Fe-Mo cluster-binding NifX family protein
MTKKWITRRTIMRIAFSSDEDRGLESAVAHHFGRCPYYVFVNREGNEVQSVETMANPFFQSHRPGQVPGYIHEQGADVMISGGMGRRAIAFFQELGVEAFTGASGTVSQTLSRYLAGELSEAAPCGDSVAHGEHGHRHHHD